MSVAGLCQVCENAQAEHACRTCGRQVCDDHWSDTVRACSACARGVDADDPGGEGPASGGEGPDPGRGDSNPGDGYR
ncbi:hypothetical protein J2751_000004 [Halorubrum alkaliphilum]|uniref:HIT-type domain-containing protein n=1 Tax=Halorubrum alkaliphilum TaxID=261290 RepID=A0A8T4GC05_9EURY|nr:hypothetical protein [Halorubrum alkaliphilum]MBP1921021.1 hypothetical protein [Halorubrum alkaliphilum]